MTWKFRADQDDLGEKLVLSGTRGINRGHLMSSMHALLYAL